MGLPSRTMDTGTSRPTGVLATAFGRRSARVTFSPLNSTMTSPGLRPAFSAGEPSVTLDTSAPADSESLRLLARSAVTGWMATPSQPRTTRPVDASCARIGLARFTGMAKPIPIDPPVWLKIAALIPTAWPLALMSGPPLLPGLIDASVRMKSSYGPPPITRPVPLTMPVAGSRNRSAHQRAIAG